MNMKKSAGLIQAMGRNGDTMLAHINPQEARMLKAAGGAGTINPETGLPEYFKLKKLFKAAAVVVGAYFLGPAGAGLLSAGASTGAMIGAGVSGLTGGNPLKGAIIGGIGGFVMGGGLNNVSGWLGETSSRLSPQGATAASGSLGANTAAPLTTAGQAAANAGISTSVTPQNFLMASPEALAASATPAASAAPAFSMANVPGYVRPAVAAAAPSASSGLINSALTWAGNNPVPALMAGQSVLAGVGGMSQAQAEAEQAQLNREASMENSNLNREASMVKGGWGASTNTVAANDPNMVTDMNGRYIRGPKAGQYAPGRAPAGLISAGA